MNTKTNSNPTSEAEDESYSFLNSDEYDTRSELKFDDVTETDREKLKRKEIEDALNDDNSTIITWKRLAISKYGLVNDQIRRQVWPLLLGLDPDPSEKVPSLLDLSNHEEYNQVVLDVNRSLKRFPPGIPYKKRVALQDQLTVLILRVIMKYPHLRYYQGYHDVAVTFLLVVGETVAFRIMEVLSTDHLKECMESTMEKTSYRLNYMYVIIQKADRELYEFLERANVGTMFALPWYLTWFGHSLNQYRDVVRLYDFFLASPALMPIYVAAALVIHRRSDIFNEFCDMASIHCLLSQIPDNLDFEEILVCASRYYEKYPPHKIEKDVKKRVQRELDQRRREERLRRIQQNRNNWVLNYVPQWLLLHYRNRYGILFAAATVLFGIYAYLRATEKEFSLFRGTWNS